MFSFVTNLKNKINEYLKFYKNKYTDSVIIDNNCIICKQDIENNSPKVILKDDYYTKCQCNYGYHKRCLLRWFEYNRTCPLCKRDVDNSRSLFVWNNIRRYLIYIIYLIIVFFILYTYKHSENLSTPHSFDYDYYLLLTNNL
jgi:hypothetical protein